MSWKMSCLGLALFTLLGCDSALQETKKSVAATAAAINSDFVTVRAAEETLVAEISGLYDKLGTLDLSTKGMDESEGGIYAMFPGNKYYYKTKPQGSALYLSPGKPLTEAMRRSVKFFEHIDPFLQKAGSATDVQVTAFFGSEDPYPLALLNPWFDVVSLLPPGLTLQVFEWYNRGLKSPGPPVWSAKPFTDLNHGWVMDVSAPLTVAGANKGVAVISVDLAKVSAKHIKSRKGAILLMGSDTTVVGLSPEAEDLLDISALQSVDYLKQVKDNAFAPGKYRLDDASQAPGIQALGRELSSGKSDFTLSLAGKDYSVVQEKIVENSMSVVGFTLR